MFGFDFVEFFIFFDVIIVNVDGLVSVFCLDEVVGVVVECGIVEGDKCECCWNV